MLATGEQPAAGGFIYAFYHLINKPNFNRVPQLSDGQIRGYIASNYTPFYAANYNQVKHIKELFEWKRCNIFMYFIKDKKLILTLK